MPLTFASTVSLKPGTALGLPDLKTCAYVWVLLHAWAVFFLPTTEHWLL